MLEFLETLLFLESGTHVEVLSLVVFAVEGLDGFGGAARSIFNIVFGWRAVANEKEFLSWVFGACTTMQ